MAWVKNPVAYCKLHRFHMSVKQMKKKDCLGKGCWHLSKIQRHQFWTASENSKKKHQKSS